MKKELNYAFKLTPNTKCMNCKKPIYKRPYQIAKEGVYCSHKCQGLKTLATLHCLICGTKFPKKRSNFYCSKTCSNKNRIGKKYNRGYEDGLTTSSKYYSELKKKLLKERGAKCEKCSYDNKNILQFHHKIERHKGGKNTSENLLIVCPNCHTTIHLGDSRLER
jgi:HNH endonuclease